MTPRRWGLRRQQIRDDNGKGKHLGTYTSNVRDGRLMAAAPQLYNALKRMLEFAGKYGCLTGRAPLPCGCVVCEAHEAIWAVCDAGSPEETGGHWKGAEERNLMGSPTTSDGQVKGPVFPAADYYTCSDDACTDDEHLWLEHRTPEEAIEGRVDLYCFGRTDLSVFANADVSAVIREMGDIEVYAYDDNTVSDKHHTLCAEFLIEQAVEYFDEEYGDPEGIDEAASKDALPLFVEAVRHLWAHAIMKAVSVGSTTLTPEQVEAMMREHRPDWWERNE